MSCECICTEAMMQSRCETSSHAAWWALCAIVCVMLARLYLLEAICDDDTDDDSDGPPKEMYN